MLFNRHKSLIAARVLVKLDAKNIKGSRCSCDLNIIMMASHNALLEVYCFVGETRHLTSTCIKVTER